nr:MULTISPECIES: MalM family protein [unclassified Vibrio]
MIKKWLAPLLVGVLVTGCTSTEQLDLQQNQSAEKFITHLENVSWNVLDIPTEVEFTFNQSSQLLLDGKSAGPVAGFIIPGNRGSLDISLASFVSNDLNVYAPTVVILDGQGKEIYKKTFSDFQYYPAKMLDNDQFVTTFNVIPDMTGQELKVLIYTTAEDLAGTSQILHPAKAHALARHTQPPDIADPYANHSLSGHLRLTITANDMVSKHIVSQSDVRPQGTELTLYYHSEIKKAVEENNIPKALGLLDEAKALDIKDAQDVFIKAINTQK